jgi:hypothetical protein
MVVVHMNDKRIRDILISYLKAVNNEIRIYQEKSIGSSICDIMAVTDKLTGYEIKSDLDNYSRLEEQIKQYNKFFDENYIVVSSKHIKSVSEKVPNHWGIIYILDDNVQIERIAKSNFLVSRRRQLSILWKLELKNILIKNNLSLFAQKEKGVIADRINSSVESKKLGKQIASELLHRDYSIFDAKDYSIYSKKEGVADFPVLEIVDTLSENNLSDFTLDKWIALYQQAKKLQKEKEVKFVEKEERKEHSITYADISVSLGAPWISKEIIEEFIVYLLELEKKNFINVYYEPVTGNWSISNKNRVWGNTKAEVTYGLERYNALWIIEATLNLREIKLYTNNEYDEQDTLVALEKQKLIQEKFSAWIFTDEDRKWEVEEAYNNMFSDCNTEKYDGSKLEFPNMNPEFSLFDYQKDAVQKIITTDNTMLAFDVGAGKTFIMIAAAMKMRSSGLSRKNMFVVPNSLVGQWEKIFTSLYPNSKALAIEPKTFKPEMRTKVLRQIRDGDYDGIIIAYSCFEIIPLSVNYITNQLSGKLKMLDYAVKNLRTAYDYGRASIDREKQYLVKITNEFINSLDFKTIDITFDELEINSIFLDEAHNYKNIPIRTKLKNLYGINIKGSNKCLDMLHKIRCVQEQNNGRGAIFATGTPLCNSISDVYAIQIYLQYEKLYSIQLDKFDNWVKTFALPEQNCEIDVDTSKYRFVRRFTKFFNLPELSKLFSQIAIFYAMDKSLDIPENTEYKDVIVKKNKPLTDYMQTLCERTERIRAKKVNKSFDNMLKVSTDGRKAALDLTLVGKIQKYDDTSKIYKCVNNVIENYNKYSGCSQLIFCDYSTPKGENFSVYKVIKEQLIAKKIPEKEIAFVHSYNTELKRVKLFENVNKGVVRVLIGSTFKLGIGANVQTKLKAIHHLDVPWRPADMVQREGRILRRGNENKNVIIYRYIAEGSFDSYSWQILETKQKFISQFLSGTSYQRSMSDLENNILTYAEVKALALSQPLMKQLAEKENELSNLRILNSKEIENNQHLKSELEKIKVDEQNLFDRKNKALLDKDYLSKISITYNKDNQIYKDRLSMESLFSNIDKPLFYICGFRVLLPNEQDEKHPYILLQKNTDYIVKMGNSPWGNIKRIVNFLKSFDKEINKINRQIEEYETRIIQIKNQLSSPNQYAEKLAECKRERDKIMQLIKIQSSESEPVWKN